MANTCSKLEWSYGDFATLAAFFLVQKKRGIVYDHLFIYLFIAETISVHEQENILHPLLDIYVGQGMPLVFCTY